MNKQCVIYCRVSTTKQAQEGESLEIQEKICRGIAIGRKLEIAGIFSEPFSGRKDRRPAFDEMMDFIKKQSNHVGYVIVRVIDRFTRGGSLSYESIKANLARYGVELIDSTGIIQPAKNTLEHLGIEYEWSKHAPSEIAEIVMANYGKTEVTNILTRLIGREIELVRDGYQIGQPNDGMLNKKIYVEGKKKTIQVPDPERAEYYIKMFEWRASGRYNDEEVVSKVNAMGFRSRERNVWDKNHSKIIGKVGGTPLTVKKLQKFVLQPNYCGIICERWTNYQPVKARYEGLVSVEVFNKANNGKLYVKQHKDGSLQMLYDHLPTKFTIKRQKNNPLFPFRHVISCAYCKKPLLGSSPKGKSGKGFPTYHCARGHKYFGVRKNDLDSAVENFVKNIKYKKDYADKLQKVLLDQYHNRQKDLAKYSSHVSQNVATLKMEMSEAVSALIKTKSEIAKQEIEKRIDNLEKQILDTQEERQGVEITEYQIKAFINYVKYLMEHLEDLLIVSDNNTKQQAMFGLLFKEFPTYQEILNGTPKLSLTFELSQQYAEGKTRLVDPTRIEPFYIEIIKWHQFLM